MNILSLLYFLATLIEVYLLFVLGLKAMRINKFLNFIPIVFIISMILVQISFGLAGSNLSLIVVIRDLVFSGALIWFFIGVGND